MMRLNCIHKEGRYYPSVSKYQISDIVLSIKNLAYLLRAHQTEQSCSNTEIYKRAKRRGLYLPLQDKSLALSLDSNC